MVSGSVEGESGNFTTPNWVTWNQRTVQANLCIHLMHAFTHLPFRWVSSLLRIDGGKNRDQKNRQRLAHEIDLNLDKQEWKSFKRQCNVLLISSCPLLLRQSYRIADRVYLPGIPESEVAAYVFIKRMKTLHDSRPNDEVAQFTNQKLADFRPVVWKILLMNSQSIARSIQSRKVGSLCHSNKVRYMSCSFSIFCLRWCLYTGKVRVHHESPNRHRQSCIYLPAQVRSSCSGPLGRGDHPLVVGPSICSLCRWQHGVVSEIHLL